MPAKLTLAPTIHSEKIRTVNFPATFTHAEIGKAVKLDGADSYVLCTSGDKIEGIVTSVEEGTRGGVKVGGIVCSGYFEAVNTAADVVVGDVVVAGAQPAIGTPNPVVGTKGVQPTSIVVGSGANGSTEVAPFLARVVGFAGGTGAQSTTVIVEFI